MPETITPRTGGPEDVPPCEGWYLVRSGHFNELLAVECIEQGDGEREFFFNETRVVANKWHGPLAPPEGF